MAITAYKIVTCHANDVSNINAQIADAIADGWQPQGGPTIHEDRIAQALVQIEADPEP